MGFFDRSQENLKKYPGDVLVRQPKEYLSDGMRLTSEQFEKYSEAERCAPNNEMLDIILSRNEKMRRSGEGYVLLFLLFAVIGLCLSIIFSNGAHYLVPFFGKVSSFLLMDIAAGVVSAIITISVKRYCDHTAMSIADAVRRGRYSFFRCKVKGKGTAALTDEDGTTYSFFIFLGIMVVRTDEAAYYRVKDGGEVIFVIVDTDRYSRIYFPTL